MPDYRETIKTVEEKSWRRSHQVLLSNPLAGVKSVTCFEEDATSIDGETKSVPAGDVSALFNPADTFPLINPETGERTGSMTHLEVYVIMHSLYIHLATQRDEAQRDAQ